MNKTAIKNYAVEARKKWIQAIAQQAAFYGCTESGSLSDDDITKQLADKGEFLTRNELHARSRLVNDIRIKGYQNVIEEVAYTWFNRLIAIRFMEVNGYLPSGIRVLSSIDADRIEPDCVREYARLDFLNQDTAAKLATESDEKLYRYILVEQCNALGKIMPKMFTHIADYAALLLPKLLYIKDGLVHDLTHAISEADFGEQVEIIGWLYQYYISEKKDEVFAALKKNVKITRENIPAATQLFTPEWIVRYMVENSLGRLWLEHIAANGEGYYYLYNDDGSDAAFSVVTTESVKELKSNWKYYINQAKQEPEVEAQLKAIYEERKNIRPVDIKFIDPCMGSGHILVYAFDVLYQIYASQGYSERDIPDLILENNIFGLDIDERACQLAYFALMMKARSYNRRFFRREDVPQPQVYSPQADEELLEYGSLYKADTLDPMPEQADGQIALDDIKYADKLNDWNFHRLLHQKYDVVVTNPPYMGSGGMNRALLEYVKHQYPYGKTDLFAVFILRVLNMTKTDGLFGMITMQSWMFTQRYVELREQIHECALINLIHIGYNSFPELNSKIAQATAFIGSPSCIKGFISTYVDLTNNVLQNADKHIVFKKKQCENDYITLNNELLLSLPGYQFAYWISPNMLKAFSENKQLGLIASPRQGLATGDNDSFLRYWQEIDYKQLGLGFASTELFHKSTFLYAPYNKGGAFRKWYGNRELVIKFNLTNYYILSEQGNHLPSKQFYFNEGINWSALTTSSFSCRYNEVGFVFDTKGSSCFFHKPSQLYPVMGFLNSVVANEMLKILSPTVDYNAGTIANVPIVPTENEHVERVTRECISIARNDWDSFETSWDFQTHPLIMARGNYEETQPLMVADDIVEGTVVTGWSKTSAPPIAQAFDTWERETDRRFDTLKANEEELNCIFIDIYGLQDELTPEVEDKDVTVRRADLGRETRSFISYAVGCMFGRYSLDVPGLAYAGGDWDASKYNSFIPEDDNILPITNADYFEDDIVMRFVDFVKVVYGEETLAENLEFIARTLYPNSNGTAREMIRRYFQNDFFKDHCKIYQKRPIYWLFDSGKQNGFKALIYLHRYDKYTIARVRTEYLHPLQRKYEAEIERMNKLADLPETSARDKAEFKKQTEKISKQITECRTYDQIISHMAAQTIELDLDDGVKVNYEKFQSVEVPRDDGKGAVKMDLLGKI